MELSKKTTILLSPRLYAQLKDFARARSTSMGELIRFACEQQYGLPAEAEALTAVEYLTALALPVDSPAAMKAQSVPTADELLP